MTRAAGLRHAEALTRHARWDACVLGPAEASFLELRPGEAAELQRLAARVPVVVTTGRAWATQVQAVDLGVRAILRKPYDLGELARILDALVPCGRG